MLDSAFNAIEKLISEFTWSKLLSAFLLFAILVGSLWIYESYSGHIRLRKLERATAILENLCELENSISLQTDEDLTRVYDSLKSELEIAIGRHQARAFDVPYWVWKSLSAASLWLLFALAFVRGTIRGENNAFFGLFGSIFFAIIFAVAGGFIPTAPWPMLNYVAFPLVNFFVTVIFVLTWSRIRKIKQVD